MRAKIYFAIGIFIALLFAAANQASAQTWTLTWADEFDGAANSAPNSTKWGYDIGGGGWGNNELQTYTRRTQNAYLDGEGNLIIKVLKETFTGSDGITRNYTSARLLTKGKFEQKYGRFEVRIKVPFGQGIWPAFWMLGNDIDTVSWPRCGEIDIMEIVGKAPSINHGSLHGPGYSGGNPLTGIYTLSNDQRFTDDFHTFAVEWEPTAVRFYVDGNLYHTKTPANVPTGSRWVFDHPFFMIVNVAVGGNFPGNPDDTTTFPQTMVVDYVRVYANADTRPSIRKVSIQKKHLLVEGDNFDSEAAIWMDGERQKTLHDEQNPNLLTGKKVAKKISSGQTVNLQVKNSDNLASEEVSFTRP
jgi:beta-glucanase (GH16 family)